MLIKLDKAKRTKPKALAKYIYTKQLASEALTPLQAGLPWQPINTPQQPQVTFRVIERVKTWTGGVY